MIRVESGVARLDCRAPRVCGDDPNGNVCTERVTYVLPAYAGMIPAHGVNDWTDNRAPRVCGDDPNRGLYLHDLTVVLPAYAGMIP